MPYFKSHDFKVLNQIKGQVIRKNFSNLLHLTSIDFYLSDSLQGLHIFKQFKYVFLQTSLSHHLNHQSTKFYSILCYHIGVMNYQHAKSKKCILKHKVYQIIQGIDSEPIHQNFPKFYLLYT